MVRSWVFFCLTVLILGTVSCAEPASKTDKWEKEIAALEAKSKAIENNQQRILFVGSSSIRLWELEKSFPEWQWLNHGFGGSQIADSVQYFERLIVPFQPKVVVFYAGDNDLASKKTPEQVAQDFQAFIDKFNQHCPDAKFIYIPIKPSPSRWKLFDQQQRANGAIKSILASDARRFAYVDIVTPMLDAQGQPRSELFKKDMLHMNDEGYVIWSKLVSDQVGKFSGSN